MTRLYRQRGKRVVDIGLSVLAIALLFPVLAATAIAVRLDDGGPILFRQRRSGRHGKEFTIYKFRSMPQDIAEVPSVEVRSLRVTRVGRLIRRSSIDELPQLFNIVKGDMSIVGPRPCLKSQLDVIELRKANGAASLRPGLTGWAQVNSFDGMSAEKKSRLDGEYFRRSSALFDAVIIARTVLYLLKPPPSY